MSAAAVPPPRAGVGVGSSPLRHGRGGSAAPGAARSRHGAALAMLLAVTGLAGCQSLDSFLYLPTPAASDADLLAGATAVPAAQRRELRGIHAVDGTEVNAWLLAHEDGDGTNPAHHGQAILYCHGNSGNVAHFAGRLAALWSRGYTVVAFDYRGYGKTPGAPTEAGVVADARAVRAYVEAGLAVPRARVALYGYSLGAAIAAELAGDAPPPALILEAPFASIRELVADGSTLDLPANWFADTVMDTLSTLESYRGALLVLHGSDDRLLPARYGAEIVAQATLARPATFVRVPGAGHDSVPCADPHDRDCHDGFAPAYFAQVEALLDGALAPAE